MANSIRDNLDANDTISEIKLLLSKSRKNVCIVVEGINDQRLFKPLLADNVLLLQSYSGKRDILTIVKQFPRNMRVIGIRDRDYTTKSGSKRIFFNDYCCAEMMIISLDDCFRRTYSYFYKGELSFSDLRMYCFEHLEQLSKVRKLNEINNWSINFETFKISNIYDNDIIEMNKKLINAIVNCKVNKVSKHQLEQCHFLKKCISITDFLEITNGHDFVEMFKIMCAEKRKSPNNREIESNIHGTFGPQEFKKTKLYSTLMDYQVKKKLVIIN